LTTECRFLKHARAAAEAGFRVFPIRPGLKAPALKDWQQIATSSAKAVERLWRDHPTANIGVLTGGRVGLFVLDVDGTEGQRSLKKLERRHGRLPWTVVVRTPHGSHYYFHTDEPLRNSVGKLGPGLDVRTEGACVVGAGSVNGEGVRYRYATGRGPDDVDIAQIPDWLPVLLSEDSHNATQSSNSSFQSGIATPRAAAALQDEAETVRGAPEGTRNHRLIRISGDFWTRV
jgi:putative DNA primase/helicase